MEDPKVPGYKRMVQRIKEFIKPPGDEATQLRSSILRRQVLLNRLDKLLPFFHTALICAGFAYLLALPWEGLHRGHYVSENALQPGQVNTYWNWADVHIADMYAKDVESWMNQGLSSQERATAIQNAFLSLGYPASTQSYSYTLYSHKIRSTTRKLNGTNAYAILHAPKTDGAEALVLSASWLSRALDGNGERRVNVRGVAAGLALANYLKKYSMWSKDIIFLFPDGYSDGTQAWLDSYHGYHQTNLNADQLSLTTGPIWASLNLDYPHHSFEHVGLFYEGTNAHLPNLDFINSASHILQYCGIQPILHSDVSLVDPFPPSLFHGTLLPFLDISPVRAYERAARNLVRQLIFGASGRASGPEGMYGRYRIDAITFFAVPAEGPHGFHSLGKAVESTFRSLNNLLERFHQSFFLYIMTSVNTFITVGNYLAAPVLISAGMTVMGLSMWRDSSPSSAALGPKLRTSGLEVGMERPIGKAVALIGLTHLIGAGMFIFVTNLDPTRRSHPELPLTLGINLFVAPLFLAYLFTFPPDPSRPTPLIPLAPLSSVLKSFNLILGGLTIAVVATLNFGAAALLSLLLCLPLTLTQPNSNELKSRVQQLGLLAISPPSIWALFMFWNKEGADRWLKETLEDWAITGGWSLPFAFVVVVPLLLQAATAALV